MAMREVEHKDREGRMFLVLLPEGVPEDESAKGVRLGPPALDALDLPLSLEVKLNNELFHRRLIREVDVRTRRHDVIGALMATLSLDAGKITALYSLTRDS